MNHELTILIVDDQKQNRNLLHDQVLTLGHKPVLAENGLSALAVIHRQAPDLVLLDIMMPQMDGIEVLESLKADPRFKELAVIVISAMDDMDTLVRCIQLGAMDYFCKPFKSAILKARIQGVLAQKQLKTQENEYKRKLEEYNLGLEERVRERTIALENSQREVIHRLSIAGEFRDEDTGLHVKRMSCFSRELAKKAGMSEQDCEMILYASPMHDVGKIGIPDSILLKPGKLEGKEWEIMKSHAEIGGAILGESESSLVRSAKTIALSHHEKWDGSGYPGGLKKEDIPLMGRIVCIADVFDALTSPRPYKKAWPTGEAEEFLKNEKGKHFDPDLVSLFIEALPEMLEIKRRFSSIS